MKIQKGTFKVREQDSSEQRSWAFYEGSYGNDFPFYVHRKSRQKYWTLSHMSTGYMIRKNLSLKDARRLCKALKKWPLFLMPTAEAIIYQKSLLSTHKQNLLNDIVNNLGESNE